MSYKTGETPQKNDEVMGEIEGQPGRGRVMAVLAPDKVRVARRGAYQGPHEPLTIEFHDLPTPGLSLIYRPEAKANPLPKQTSDRREPTKAAPKKAAAEAAKK